MPTECAAPAPQRHRPQLALSWCQADLSRADRLPDGVMLRHCPYTVFHATPLRHSPHTLCAHHVSKACGPPSSRAPGAHLPDYLTLRTTVPAHACPDRRAAPAQRVPSPHVRAARGLHAAPHKSILESVGHLAAPDTPRLAQLLRLDFARPVDGAHRRSRGYLPARGVLYPRIFGDLRAPGRSEVCAETQLSPGAHLTDRAWIPPHRALQMQACTYEWALGLIGGADPPWRACNVLLKHPNGGG